MLEMIKQFVRDEEGAVAIEYALLAALIALAIVAGAGALGTELSAFFQAIATWLGLRHP
ncbi:MAG: pilus assembly protein Flp/PilA [Azoarcus sp.]|nr:pilus assembly protein Flp/PilA [Azoarcus sp.]